MPMKNQVMPRPPTEIVSDASAASRGKPGVRVAATTAATPAMGAVNTSLDMSEFLARICRSIGDAFATSVGPLNPQPRASRMLAMLPADWPIATAAQPLGPAIKISSGMTASPVTALTTIVTE
jgi:hypothetical protein